MTMKITTLIAPITLAFTAAANAQKPVVHQLPATPATVVHGYYWSDAKPALKINSGDIVEIETMLTSSAPALERMGAKPEEIPQFIRDIMADTAAKRVGGHILTGPIYVEGADSGDVLEVRIQSITLPIPFGYNGFS